MSEEFLRAVKEGDIAKVRTFLSSYEQTDSTKWSDGYSLLLVALENGHHDVANLLLDAGACVDNEICDPADTTPLHNAVGRGYTDIVGRLLSKGARVNALSSRRITPLEVAIRFRRSDDLVDLLLQHGADPNTKLSYYNTGRKYLDGFDQRTRRKKDKTFDCRVDFTTDGSVLQSAIVTEDTELFKKLLDYGADVNGTADVKTDKKCSVLNSLMLAACEGYADFTSLLLEKGAAVNVALVPEKVTALHMAVWFGQKNSVDVLLKQPDIDLDSKDSVERTPLHYAAGTGDAAMVERLLSRGARINSMSSRHETPLHIAIRNRYLNLYELLLQRGADPNIRVADYCRSSELDDEKRLKCGIDYEAIYRAIQFVRQFPTVTEDHQCVNNLLDYGAEVNETADIKTDTKCSVLPTTLMMAAFEGNADFTSMLLEKGAVVNAALMPKEVTALHMAVCFQREKVVDVLLKRPDIALDFKDYEMKTPLHYAVENCDAAIALTLLKRGASVNCKDHLGKTPLDCAVEVGHEAGLVTPRRESVVEVLLRFGADPNARDNIHGYTSLHYWAANEIYHQGIVSSLMKYGADIDLKSTSGKTPLYVAVEKGFPGHVSDLLRLGADVNIPHIINEEGEPSRKSTPLMCAEENYSKAESPGSFRRLAESYAEKCVRECKDSDDDAYDTFMCNFYERTYDYEEFSTIANAIRRNIIELDCANFYVNERDLQSSIHPRDYGCDGSVFNPYLERGLCYPYRDDDDDHDDDDDDDNDGDVNDDDDCDSSSKDYWYVRNKADKYRRQCLKELSLLKRKKVRGNPNISFYDFLTKSSNKLAKLFEEENIAEIMSSAKFRRDLRSFVIYRNLINNRLNMALKRVNLLKSATQCFEKVCSLPDLCVDTITDYLTNIDLSNFVRACEQTDAKCSRDSLK